MTMRRAWMVGVLALLYSTSAAADPVQRSSSDPQAGPLVPVTSDDDPHDEFDAFPTVRGGAHEKHYVRAGLMVGGILIVGYVDYLLNTTARGGISKQGDLMWDWRYDWPDLRAKFTGAGYNIDSNKFNTNYISHPFAGSMYFMAARSNHLSFAEAFIYSILGSSIWEIFGEIREKAAVNDLLTTPSSGAAIGEPLMQLGAFFDRGKDTPANAILSTIFSPVKALSDVFDPVEKVRTKHPDALGFPTEPWHRFEIYGGAGPTVQTATKVPGSPTYARATYADVRFGVHSEVRNLPGYAGAGRHARLFDDGNVSSIAFDAAMSRGNLVDAVFATRAVPIGFYYRRASLDREGNANGQGAIVGLRLGFEYGIRDYDRDRARPTDLVTIVSPVGIAAEHVFERGGLRLTTSLDIAGAISGIQPYALTDYLATHPVDGLPQATQSNGYYHAWAVTAQPGVAVRYGAFETGGSLRFDTFRAIEGLDEAAVDPALAAITDKRTTLDAFLAFQPRSQPWRLSIGARRITRSGDVGPAHVSRTQSSINGTLGLVF